MVPLKCAKEQSQELVTLTHSLYHHPPFKRLHYFYLIGCHHSWPFEDVLMKVDRREMIE